MTRVSKGLKATYPIENMIGAVEAVRAGSSVREAAAKYGVPKSTLGDCISGRIDVEARPGRAPVIPKDIEDAMVSKAMSCAIKGLACLKGRWLHEPEPYVRQWVSETTLQTEYQERRGGLALSPDIQH